MRFYALEVFPRGDADTCAEEELGYNQGDAPSCPACGGAVGMLTWLPPFRVLLKLYGKEFGDFAFFSGGDYFLVSQKFCDVYRSHQLAGLSGFDPVEVLQVKSRKRLKSQPPPYFHVNASYGQTALDQVASGCEWLEEPCCQLCREGSIIRWKRLIIEEGTWNGDDIFRPRGFSGEIMVSQRFKDVCDESGIKNAVFTPAETAGHDFYPGMKDPSELNLPPR
jgi:hypothetical protein